MLSYKISHYNQTRGENQLVIYNQGASTKTNKYGYEICVENGRAISCGGNDSAIPKGGFVVSGHGNAAVFLCENICIGTRVFIEDNTVYFETDTEANILFAEKQINDIKDRIAELEKENIPYNKAAVSDLLTQATAAKENCDFMRVKELAREAYFHTAKTAKDEIRAVWHRPLEKTPQEVEKRVSDLKNAGFNSILIETNYGGFANATKCAKECLPVRDGYESFDIIGEYVSQCKKQGIKIHCWYENFFCGTTYEPCAIAEIHPQWLAQRKDGGYLLDGYDCFYFLNPVLPQVQEYLLNSIKEILDKYDFDGFQLDYIRYPAIRDIHHAAGFDNASKQQFLEETGIDIDTIQSVNCPQWKQYTLWCGTKITEYVKKVKDLIDEYRKNGRYIELSTAVIGEPKEATEQKCQNWLYWVKQGWLDCIYPMAYYNDPLEVEKEIAHMVSNYGEAANISGIAPFFNGLTAFDAVQQVEAARKAGAQGVAFFAAGNFKKDSLQKLRLSVFRA